MCIARPLVWIWKVTETEKLLINSCISVWFIDIWMLFRLVLGTHVLSLCCLICEAIKNAISDSVNLQGSRWVFIDHRTVLKQWVLHYYAWFTQPIVKQMCFYRNGTIILKLDHTTLLIIIKFLKINNTSYITWYGGGGPKCAGSFPSTGLSPPLSKDMSSFVGLFKQLPIVPGFSWKTIFKPLLKYWVSFCLDLSWLYNEMKTV